MSPNQKVVEQVEVKQVSEQCNMHNIKAHMFNSEEFSLDPHSDLLYTIFGPIILHAHLAHRLETGNQNGDKMVAKKKGRDRKKRQTVQRARYLRIIKNNLFFKNSISLYCLFTNQIFPFKIL